jgi:sodium/hydrogen antiporter
MTGLVLMGIIAMLYAAVATQLDRFSLGAPLIFLVAGAALGPGFIGTMYVHFSAEPFKILTELTLALVLFADASTIGLSQLRADVGLPTRLLFIGLPLTIGLGTVLAVVTNSSIGWASAALVAAILAPTDAALSLPVITNPRVPVRIRRALNVESGLNDGIAAPIVGVLIAVIVAEDLHGPSWPIAAVKSIGYALLVAAGVGGIGGQIAVRATARGWSTRSSEQLFVIAAAPLAYITAVSIDGNGFVAAFIAGLLFGFVTRHGLVPAASYAETTGLLLSFAVWALFGASLVGPVLRSGWHGAPVLYAILSLTVVRLIPVALALIGSRLRPITVLFVGWFGPRGLASVVFLIIAVDDLRITSVKDVIVQTVVWTILLSVVLHGLTSKLGANHYATQIARVQPLPAELDQVKEPYLRRRNLNGP